MKRSILVFVLALFSFLSYSQGVTLTKGETIEYLNKKIKESIGHTLTNNNGTIGAITDAEVKPDAKGVIINFKYKYSDGSEYMSSFTFNPAHIKSITYYTNETASPVNEIQIALIGKTCVKYTGKIAFGFTYAYPYPQPTSVDYANFMYLRADPANLEKIKKAFLHLQSLLKAEDDPFQ